MYFSSVTQILQGLSSATIFTMADAAAFTILALYKFVSPQWTTEEVHEYKKRTETFLRDHLVRGAILISTEGINGTLCYPTATTNATTANNEDSNDIIVRYFTGSVKDIRTRISYSPTNVFFRLRIRIKTEIVTMGVDGICPTVQVGEYVKPGPEWDALIQDPNTLVIDARNEYEYQVGTFRNAVNPKTQSFTELPKWLQENVLPTTSRIAMFCTGGIRCEKATSYALQIAPNVPVMHLEGGILAYLDTVPKDESTFDGECYVFDQRIAVTHGLVPSDTYQACHACRHVLTPVDRQHEDYVYGVCCCYCKVERQDQRHRYESRQMHIQVAEKRGIPHIHDSKELVHVSRRGVPQSCSGIL
jgi:UPF0176 protein